MVRAKTGADVPPVGALFLLLSAFMVVECVVEMYSCVCACQMSSPACTKLLTKARNLGAFARPNFFASA
jgi:hypothetical protein